MSTAWIYVEPAGSYYRVEDGVLEQCPAAADESRIDDPAEVVTFDGDDGLLGAVNEALGTAFSHDDFAGR